MKKTSANSVPCACCGRRLPRKRVRRFCNPSCKSVADLLLRRRRETGAGGQR